MKTLTVKFRVNKEDLAALKRAAHLSGRRSIQEYVARATFAYTEHLIKVVADAEQQIKELKAQAEANVVAHAEPRIEAPAESNIIIAKG